MSNEIHEPTPPRYPLGVMPVQSDHGDVHHLIVCRSDGSSATVDDLRWVHWRITGRTLADREIPVEWFAEEDR